VTIPETSLECAAFILRETQLMGIRVGTDGSELIMIAPVAMPRTTRLWFENKIVEYRADVIAVIQRENAAGRF
jgi:hypothetical protein